MNNGELTKAIGGNAWDAFADTSAHTGVWFAIIVLEDATLAADDNVFGWTTGSANSLSLKAGQVVPGRITSIKLSSGKVLACRI